MEVAVWIMWIFMKGIMLFAVSLPSVLDVVFDTVRCYICGDGEVSRYHRKTAVKSKSLWPNWLLWHLAVYLRVLEWCV